MSKGYASNQMLTRQEHQTLQDIGAGKHAADMVPKALYATTALELVATGGGVEYTKIDDKLKQTSYLELAASGAKVGSVIRMTSGALDGIEVAVSKVDGDRLYFSYNFGASEVVAGDTFYVMEYITLTITKDGELSTSSGPIQFIKDGIAQVVTEDTVDPSNNAPLPVKLTSVTGDINITAGDLNVQTSHVGASADSMRLGNGVNELAISADLEAQVHDPKALAEALLLKTAVAKEAKQDAANLLLTSIDGKDFATETTLATRATEATLATRASEATLATRATEVTSAAILAKMLAAPATEAKQDDIITELQAIKAGEIKSVHQSQFNNTKALSTLTYASVGTLIPNGTIIREIEVLYKNGETIEVFDANGGTSLGIVTQAGGKLPTNVIGDGATKLIHLRAMFADFTAEDLVVNLIK